VSDRGSANLAQKIRHLVEILPAEVPFNVYPPLFHVWTPVRNEVATPAFREHETAVARAEWHGSILDGLTNENGTDRNRPKYATPERKQCSSPTMVTRLRFW
jgi:hypothetical protein